jgi:hypothetical protein
MNSVLALSRGTGTSGTCRPRIGKSCLVYFPQTIARRPMGVLTAFRMMFPCELRASGFTVSGQAVGSQLGTPDDRVVVVASRSDL